MAHKSLNDTSQKGIEKCLEKKEEMSSCSNNSSCCHITKALTLYKYRPLSIKGQHTN